MERKTRAERDRQLREVTAYHEAGHAVLAVHHGRPFHHVSIEPDSGGSGRMLKRWHPKSFRPDLGLNPKTIARIEREVLISMGGMAAEARFTGRKNYRAASSDIHQSIRLASYVYGPNVVGKYIEFKIAVAEDFFQDAIHWVQVETVAAALLEKEALKSEEVTDLCKFESLDKARIRQLRQENLARDRRDQEEMKKILDGQDR